ncbi:ABC transporter ATP-binding protein [Pontibacterium granulatum]|uniref:ABC transporter ATP-binding protein n=1 Tax=Pontibacterium granulatum TaxID=2036029 RepID=UPI00249AE3BE|nr:ABC transporter ATP-binding protein [Pontibacterium granulatum]MDI3324465.1 ABC transporter ATP-binding protein [Pontibacterium granulatum]
MSVLEVSGLCKCFEVAGASQSILQDLDLRMDSGELLMLLGPSGSGKSSLLNLIAGVDKPDAGTIRMLGQDLTALDEAGRTRFRRQHIGVVYQFFNLIPTLTVMENILLPLSLNGRLDEQPQAEAQLEAMGLADKRNQFPEQLSGGEQQRVAICRALVHKPALLLADEPTGSLDNDTADLVMAQMLDTLKREKMTTIMVTHSEALTQHADRVLRLHRGRLEPVS